MAESLLRPKNLWFLLAAALLILFPYLHTWPFFGAFLGPFRTFQATMFAVWLLVVLSMNLLTGYAGQISLGHAALVAVGAYAAGILYDQYSFPLALAVLGAGLATGVLGGVFIGLPALRLSGPYLAIATFSLIVALPQILKMDIELAGLNIDLTRWTKGANGIRIAELQPPGAIDGLVDQRQWLYYTAMVAAVAMTWVAWNLVRSRIGRAFVAIRDSEIAAEQMGIDVRLYKTLAFGVSSFYAGVGGALFFTVQAFISPASMDLLTSINFLIAIVIGGLATILGSAFGALYLTFQGELISNLAPQIQRVVPSQLIQDPETLRGVIFGSALIITMISFPRGFAGFVYTLLGRSPLRAGQPLEVRQWLRSLLETGSLGRIVRVPRRSGPGPGAASPAGGGEDPPDGGRR